MFCSWCCSSHALLWYRSCRSICSYISTSALVLYLYLHRHRSWKAIMLRGHN
ncbi:uncharacterized protein BDV14DRAFT_174889 [Aspergillus stella-maris]|uniref:uncharacterized protein n=1 Tax=Aspergillus stella-maris TaxID=1810926 RepID=UPI003CCCBFAA